MDDRPKRLPTRNASHDYATPGAYFVTVCVVDRSSLFGHIHQDEMILNDTGRAVEANWNDLPVRFPGINLDAFVVMPNHIHRVIMLHDDSSADSSPMNLARILRAFKSLSARAVNGVLGRRGPLWQRSYFDRVIRSDAEWERVRAYIEQNPARWADDHENPDSSRQTTP
jgi:putative transposase